jgi:dTDP-glucose pyrophosphorylase
LLGKQYINTDDPLMIANCDQYVDINIDDYLAKMDHDKLDGLIMTMWADDPKWSFVKFDTDGRIVEVIEKKVVSNEATVGIYNYRHGRDFVAAAERMIAKNLRVNNEFYVAPAYNEMITDGAKLGVYNVGKEYAGMYGIGIPSDLQKFEATDVSRKAVAFDQIHVRQ